MAIVILVAYAGLITGLLLCAYARAANASEEMITERENHHRVVMEMEAQLTAMRRRAGFLEKNLSRPIVLKASNEQLAQIMKERKEKQEPLSELLSKGFGEPVRKQVAPAGGGLASSGYEGGEDAES